MKKQNNVGADDPTVYTESVMSNVGADDPVCPLPQRNTLKKQTGITLIALIISIIVMLILAAVSINIIMNQGIITKSQTAADTHQVAAEKEAIQIGYSEYLTKKYNGETNLTLTVADSSAKVTGNEESGWTITYANGNVYTLSGDGQIKESAQENSSDENFELLERYFMGENGEGRLIVDITEYKGSHILMWGKFINNDVINDAETFLKATHAISEYGSSFFVEYKNAYAVVAVTTTDWWNDWKVISITRLDNDWFTLKKYFMGDFGDKKLTEVTQSTGSHLEHLVPFIDNEIIPDASTSLTIYNPNNESLFTGMNVIYKGKMYYIEVTTTNWTDDWRVVNITKVEN